MRTRYKEITWFQLLLPAILLAPTCAHLGVLAAYAYHDDPLLTALIGGLIGTSLGLIIGTLGQQEANESRSAVVPESESVWYDESESIWYKGEDDFPLDPQKDLDTDVLEVVSLVYGRQRSENTPPSQSSSRWDLWLSDWRLATSETLRNHNSETMGS